jgi:hypothetical protein
MIHNQLVVRAAPDEVHHGDRHKDNAKAIVSE